MNFEQEFLQYNVSRETFKKTEAFVALLTEWNKKMNLVSKNSISDVWMRHVLDSLQLIKYLPSVQTLVDIGTGSGFPGVILALVLQEQQPQAKVVFVESIAKKTVYLKDVCQHLGLWNVEIINDRVENISVKNVDIVTARAVAALDVLLGYAFHLRAAEMVLLKGESYEDEVREADKHWVYDMEKSDNAYSQNGIILKISNLRKKK